jgi:hypothetical protein
VCKSPASRTIPTILFHGLTFPYPSHHTYPVQFIIDIAICKEYQAICRQCEEKQKAQVENFGRAELEKVTVYNSREMLIVISNLNILLLSSL